MTQRAPLCSSASLISESQLSHWEFVFAQKMSGKAAGGPLKAPGENSRQSCFILTPKIVWGGSQSWQLAHPDQPGCYKHLSDGLIGPVGRKGGRLIVCYHFYNKICGHLRARANNSPILHSLFGGLAISKGSWINTRVPPHEMLLCDQSMNHLCTTEDDSLCCYLA